MDDLPSRLEAARSYAGLSANELSKLAGLSSSHVGMIGRGHVHAPRIDVVSKIAEALGVSLDWLVRGEGPEPDAAAVRAAVERARAARTEAAEAPTEAA